MRIVKFAHPAFKLRKYNCCLGFGFGFGFVKIGLAKMDNIVRKNLGEQFMPDQRMDLTTAGFVEVLREQNFIDPALLQWALNEASNSNRNFYELVATRIPSEQKRVYSLLADYLGVDFEPLTAAKVSVQIARKLPSEFVLSHQAIPLRMEKGRLVVVTSRPKTLLEPNRISTLASCPVEMVMGPLGRVRRLIQNTYGLGADTVSKLVSDGTLEKISIKTAGPQSLTIGDNLDTTQDASVTKFVNQLLIEAVKSGASDIHIEPYEHELRVRFRIDGVLQEIPIPGAVKKLEQALISRVKVLADLDIAEKRLSQDGQIRLSVKDRTVDIRVSVLPSIYGESLVLRILDRQSQFRDLGQVGMPENMLDTFRGVLSLAQGLVLVSGPTGSGKTTTLYASLNNVNVPGKKIITVEDPVEYRLDGITQIQVKDSIGLSFSNLLRSIVRHDPDVLMIGEIRDAETARMALNAAITGHLVLATIHTNDAPTAITRLASMGIEWYMIASALKVAMGQRLVRVLCPQCKTAVKPNKQLLSQFSQLKGQHIFSASGCEYCGHRGYVGRTGIYEELVVTDEMAGIISVAHQEKIKPFAIQQGMVPLRQAGLELVMAGITSIDEVLRVTKDTASIKQK